MTDFIKDTIATLATPAQYRKAISAFFGPALATLALAFTNGTVSGHEFELAVGAGLTGFVATFFTRPNAG